MFTKKKDTSYTISGWRDIDIIICFLNGLINGIMGFRWVNIMGICCFCLILIPLFCKKFYIKESSVPEIVRILSIIFRIFLIAALIIGATYTFLLLKEWGSPF